MRLNTYSKNADSACQDYHPSQRREEGEESVSGTKLGSRSGAYRYSPSHPLLRRKGGGFSINMLVCNSWYYITCRQQSNSCGIVEVLFHKGEQTVELKFAVDAAWARMHDGDHRIWPVNSHCSQNSLRPYLKTCFCLYIL